MRVERGVLTCIKEPSEMKRIGLKALAAFLTIGRRSRKPFDWTPLITIFSTIVTFSLVGLYVWQRRGGL
jgi:hypothetical protein